MKVLLVYLNKRTDNLKLMSPAPLTLPLLAAYTPPDIEVSIVDEAFETIDYDQEVDLVATTFVLPLAHRAYKLAHEFRKRGKTIVCGGPHATLMPDETAMHFDSVVIGQGDLTWPILLDDFKKGRLKLTFTITEDKELVRAAAKSGCVGLFFGLESFNSLSLENSNKKHNIVESYKEGIKLLHDHGISVYAGMMFGFDDDRKDIFEITLEKAIELGIDSLGPKILVPYPNMPLFDRLVKENRIIHTDWSKYNGNHAVFHPRHMTAEELENGNQWFHREFHSYKSIAKRLWKSKAATWFTLPINLSKRKTLYKQPFGEITSANYSTLKNSDIRCR